MDDIHEELKKLDSLTGQDFVMNFRDRPVLANNAEEDETCDSMQWQLPGNSVITTKGRKIVGRDPNISSSTLKALMVSESRYLSDAFRHRLRTTDPKQLAEEEFMDFRELGATHLAMCIEENTKQTKADLIANYCDDRRLPFVIGAIYIDAYMKYFKPFYYSFYPKDGYIRTEWKPRRIYIQPKPKLPPEKHEFKKYYRVGKLPEEKILPCPICGNPGRLYRVGFRGKYYQVCCTESDGNCRQFINTRHFISEREAVLDWNRMRNNQTAPEQNKL